MLELYFSKPTRIRQLRRGPLAPQIDSLAADLHRQGYSHRTARNVLGMASKLSCFARILGVTHPEEIDRALIDRFLGEELATEGRFDQAPAAIHHLAQLLWPQGQQDNDKSPISDDPFHEVLDGYERYLRDVRGLTVSTRQSYLKRGRLLLIWSTEQFGARPLSSLRGLDIANFVRTHLGHLDSRSWRKKLCTETRGFLRYLYWADLLPADLAAVVPRVTERRLASLPRHLPWEKVRLLIDTVDTSHPQGMRDKAVLLLLAVLGLRNHEVRNLHLAHLHWRAAELEIPAGKGRRARVLPLTQEVGGALADYLLHGRPPVDVPNVILRHQAPIGPIAGSSGLGAIVDKHLARSGIAAPSRGTHLLRHSLATHLVNSGTPIKSIADVLGHTSINTTAIYTKVDMAHLEAVALPLPEVAL